jgi:hypothetical protein
MVTRILSYSTLIALLFASSVIGQEPVELFEATDSRGKVIRAAYAYYPDKIELRVRLTLDNRMVKSGLFRNEAVIEHLIVLLSKKDPDLFCTYKGNAILAIFSDYRL